MPSQATVDAFIAQVVSGDHVGAIRDWYAPDAWMRENLGSRREGRELLMQQEAATLAGVKSVDAQLIEPPMIAGDRVAIRWRFTFHPKEGEPRAMEEVAWQLWQGDRIVEETFFYDPRQMGR